ncbi:hypothetical protein HNQ36_002217 [Afipia massiliensis]|uniref:Uncharacterized protein n=1 Tax=Afipia massiliensis TaxID=211460 RepID=A0A840MWF9_9BRAD|nr:hypothetical protein [Afipia massiliensis]MBB5052243.1 hypothetical protein [Afipia massiliensis]
MSSRVDRSHDQASSVTKHLDTKKGAIVVVRMNSQNTEAVSGGSALSITP